MKAILVPKPGGPEALVCGEAPDPVPGPGEVVVRRARDRREPRRPAAVRREVPAAAGRLGDPRPRGGG